MNLKWFYVIFALLINANALSGSHIDAAIRLTGLTYEDSCFNVAESQWRFMENSNNITLQSWIKASIDYGSCKCEEQSIIEAFKNERTINEMIQYKYDLVTKPGDALLYKNRTEWKMLIEFIGDVEHLKLIGNYSITSDGNKLFRKDADNLLSRTVTIDNKLKTWRMWYQMLMPLTNKFLNNMQLIQKAAIANDASDVTNYWEMLSEFKNGYTISKNTWNQISSLHRKFVNFVIKRLKKKYGDSIDIDNLPPHILGSLQGYDWTPLALDVIPHASIIYEIRKNLLEKSLGGKKLYENAADMAFTILKHLPEPRFFTESNFHSQCPSKLINICKKGQMRVFTCSYPSIENYLSAHKNMAKVLIHQMSEESNPILNFANRYSAIEEGVSELFGMLSVRDSHLRTLNLLNDTDEEDARIVSLFITALNVLPRLAYYHSADIWRIDGIKNNTLKPEDLIDSWWQYRLNYEGIMSDSIKLPTFLDDDIITSNRPYLTKYIGIIFGFQIYDFLKGSADDMYTSIEKIPINKNFIKMIRDGCAENWQEAIKQYLQLYDINVNSLLTYFSPLEDYIDEYNENYDDAIMTNDSVKKLETLEDEYKKTMDHPTTTTTATTTTTTTAMTVITSSIVSTTINNLNVNMTKFSTENTRDKGNGVQPIGPNIDVTTITSTVQPIVMNDDNNIIDTGKVIKGTSKAVWAVSAVLIATIAIIIIAVFGRNRCKKTPKNRRYV